MDADAFFCLAFGLAPADGQQATAYVTNAARNFCLESAAAVHVIAKSSS